MNQAKYIVITPVRDEELYLGQTIASMISQTILPVQWIIVNDGSKDKTGEIIDKASSEHPWITCHHRNDRGFRKAGGGVIDAFYDGYKLIRSKDYDFIAKLDGDLSFAPNYFERCFEYFRTNPALGIVGGTIYNLIGGKPVKEKCTPFHVRGATKIYKRSCWDIIGGLQSVPGWDTLDELKANMKGYRSLTVEDLKLIHYRYTGAADGSWKSLVKYGLANYISGYHPLFMIMKCLKRIVQKPFIIGSLGLMWGFVTGYLSKVPQVDDKELIRYVRHQQLNRLLFKESIWS